MTTNIGNTDRIIRIILGLVIIALAVYFQSCLGLIAIIPIGTALISWCPLYSLFGLNTCPVKS